jgi:transposase-like protein
VADVFICCCDGLKGLPEAIAEVWPQATVQECVVHLVRSSLRYASRKHWGSITKALRTIYTAPTIEAARPASPSSKRPGATCIRQSSACGAPPGSSSPRS